MALLQFTLAVLLGFSPHLFSRPALAGTESDPKQILDTSRQKFPTQKTEAITVDENKKTEKKCETLKNGKVLCTEKKSGKKLQVVNPDSQVK